MEDLFAKLGTLVVVTLMLIFDWPRALAGVVLGLIARNAGRAWIIIPIGVIAIAAGGELLYSLTGFREAMTRNGLMLGLITSGITSLVVMFGPDGLDFGGS